MKDVEYKLSVRIETHYKNPAESGKEGMQRLQHEQKLEAAINKFLSQNDNHDFIVKIILLLAYRDLLQI